MKEKTVRRYWTGLAVVAVACWAGVSCTYVFGQGISTGSTKVLRVALQGADYKSIQAAVDAAEGGAEIVVENGIYTESIWIAKSRLTLRSANKHGARIVAPQKKDALGLGEGANYITLDGFDITAPGGNGIQTNQTGIKHILNHHTIVRSCYIHDCGGGGIQLNHGDYRTVEYNNGAHGIHVFLSDHVVVRNNTTWHNNWDNTQDATWRGELSCVNSRDVKWYNNIAVASSAVNGNNTAMMDGGGNRGTEWAGNLFFDSDKPTTPSVKISGGADRKAVLANNLVGTDPQFVAPGTGANADFRLKAGSPAIGTAGAANAPTSDVLGRKRDDKPDIGAYEFGAKREDGNVTEIRGPKRE